MNEKKWKDERTGRGDNQKYNEGLLSVCQIKERDQVGPVEEKGQAGPF